MFPAGSKTFDLPGWGREYRINNPDGSPQDGDYLLIDYHVEREVALVPVRHTRELHLIPIECGIARTPPKRVKRLRWFDGLDTVAGDRDDFESYILVPEMHPMQSSPPDWHHGFIANTSSRPAWPSEGLPEGVHFISDETIKAYLFDAPSTLVPVPKDQFYRDHYDLLQKLARASREYRGFQVFGPEDALKTLEAFGKAELRRYGYVAYDAPPVDSTGMK